MVDLPELQLLLELCQRFGVVLDPERVDELLVKVGTCGEIVQDAATHTHTCMLDSVASSMN